MLKKGTSASPAIAFASNVFPVPGGPISKTPLGILAPTVVKYSGFGRILSAHRCSSGGAGGSGLGSCARFCGCASN